MSGTRIEVVELCKHGEEAAHSGSDVPHHPDYWYCTGGSRRTLDPGEFVLVEKVNGGWPGWAWHIVHNGDSIFEPGAILDALAGADHTEGT